MAEPVQPLRFSTGAEPVRDLRLLNERRALLPLEPLAGAAVHADLTQWPVAGLGVLSASLGGVRHGPSPPAAPDDNVYLGITVRGWSLVEHSRGTLTLQDGDAVLLAPRPRFAVRHPRRVQFLGLRVPRRAIETRVGDVARVTLQLIQRDTPALALLTRYLGLVLQGSLAADALREPIVAHVHELIASALGSVPGAAAIAEGSGTRIARLRVIKAYIADHLTDPDLCVAAVAARQHITPRYLHRLFEHQGTTYSLLVLRLRLERVHRQLGDPRHAGTSISTLAFNAGFGDLSYFNRAFRRRFGATPTEVRRRSAAGRPPLEGG